MRRIALLALLSVLLGLAAALYVHAAAASAKSFAAAPTCCKGCAPPSGCCCAKRLSRPYTTTKFTRTTTVMATKTVSAPYTVVKGGAGAARLARRDDNGADAVFEDASEEPAVEMQGADPAPENVEMDSIDANMVERYGDESHLLVARHACPTCPVGAKLVKVSKNNAGHVKYCCPRRKTVTKTATKPYIRMIYKTVTVYPKATAAGRVFYDIDKNNKWNSPPDQPIAKAKIVLALKGARSASDLGSTISDGQGNFKIVYSKFAPGTDMLMRLIHADGQEITTLPVEANTAGYTHVDVPLIKPTKPVVSTFTVKNNTITVTGKGVPGCTLTVYGVNGTQIGTTVVPASGSFTVVTTNKFPSGSTPVTVDQTSPQGVTSDPTTVTTVVILPPPVVTNITTVYPGNKATINGTGSPGATVTATLTNGTTIGQTVVDPSGAWGILTDDFTGTPNVTLSQTDPSGTSNPSPPEPVGMTALEEPVITGWSLNNATGYLYIEGTGFVGVNLTVYDNGTAIAWGYIGIDGFWNVSTGVGLGIHNITVTQAWGVIEEVGIGALGPILTVQPPKPPVVWGAYIEEPISYPGVEVVKANGTATPNTTVEMYANVTLLVGFAISDDNGYWEVGTGTSLGPGVWNFTVITSTGTFVSEPVGVGVLGVVPKNFGTTTTQGTQAAVSTTKVTTVTALPTTTAPPTTTAGPTSSLTQTHTPTSSKTNTQTTSSETPGSGSGIACRRALNKRILTC